MLMNIDCLGSSFANEWLWQCAATASSRLMDRARTQFHCIEQCICALGANYRIAFFTIF